MYTKVQGRKHPPYHICLNKIVSSVTYVYFYVSMIHVYISNILKMSYIHYISFFLFYCYYCKKIEYVILRDYIKKLLLFRIRLELSQGPSLAAAIRLK